MKRQNTEVFRLLISLFSSAVMFVYWYRYFLPLFSKLWRRNRSYSLFHAGGFRILKRSLQTVTHCFVFGPMYQEAVCL